MACPQMTFEGITAQVWECLLREAARIGLRFPKEHSGTVSAQGATATYAWDEGSGRLTVTFTQTPEWIDCPTIGARLRQAVRVCGGR